MTTIYNNINNKHVALTVVENQGCGEQSTATHAFALVASIVAEFWAVLA
jgi:hypothetical protein